MSKKNAKVILQRTVRHYLGKLGHSEYMNKSSEEIVGLLESLYPECCTSDEMSKAEKVKFAFSTFLEIEKKKSINQLEAVSATEKQLSIKYINYMIVLNTLQNLGYIDQNESKKKENLYLKIIQIHPELAVNSRRKTSIDKTFSTFIKLHADYGLSENDKQAVLKKAQKKKNKKEKRKKGKMVLFPMGQNHIDRFAKNSTDQLNGNPLAIPY